MSDVWLELEVGACVLAADGIRTFELVDPTGRSLPPFEAGAHLKVRVGDFIRHYSLANDPAERHRYLLGVLDDPKSRGGSRAIHDQWRSGARVSVSPPVNHFPLSCAARRHILIAGGIGITPIRAMAHRLQASGADFMLHYCAREESRAAFIQELQDTLPATRLHFVFDRGEPGRGLDVCALLKPFEPGHHVYVCGPQGLIQAVREAAGHWPADHVHFESFAAAETTSEADAAFEVELARSGARYVVPKGRSILEVLEAEGYRPPSLCREGYCGTCILGVVAGVPEHRDTALTEAEKADGDLIAICCSRARGSRLVLDL
jgi:vanillate O-demethylase ferredoxin subunit